MIGESLEYTIDGRNYIGHIAYDDTRSGPRPGIILVHEWWGLNDFVREQADKLAEQGYTAFAIDMYGDAAQADNPDDAKAMMLSVKDTPGELEKRYRGALEVLKAHDSVDPERIASQGYCFGGAVSLNMARLGLDLKGVVSFHGNLGTDIQIKPGDIKGQLQVYTGGADVMIPPEQVAAFVEEMQEAGVRFDLINYPGAQHGFTNPGATAKGQKFGFPVGYDANAARDAWEGSLAFYKRLFG